MGSGNQREMEKEETPRWVHTQIRTIHEEDLYEELPNAKSKEVAPQGSCRAWRRTKTQEKGERSWDKQYEDPIRETDFKVA